MAARITVTVLVSVLVLLCLAQPRYLAVAIPFLVIYTLLSHLWGRWPRGAEHVTWRMRWSQSKSFRAKVISFAIVGGLLLVALVSSLGRHGIVLGAPPPGVPLALRATYMGHFTCQVGCNEWQPVEVLTVAVPREAAGLRIGKPLDSKLAMLGWRRVAGSADGNLKYRRLSKSIATPVRRWPLRSDGTILLPDELFGDDTTVVDIPGGLVTAAIARDLGNDARRYGIRMYLEPEPASSLVLDYNKWAVSATSPTSDAKEAARGREQRRVGLADVIDLGGDRVELELLSPLARSQPGARLAGLTATSWGWTLVLVVLGLLVAPVRERTTDALGRLLPGRRTRKEPRSSSATNVDLTDEGEAPPQAASATPTSPPAAAATPAPRTVPAAPTPPLPTPAPPAPAGPATAAPSPALDTEHSK